ncbi:TIGR03668 family PPOX class F420-dependent oxidoreductase [Nocardiopsis mangrovi]|uniref:TIGR03668 family PPOX class F420-dependent oxidoreductase n=1 Tax=Nocardiopsis mangrovi TaxID=1179818 RepID=A0ABV9DTS9_9ACTN
MAWSVEHCREMFSGRRVARMATSGPDGRPHLVPVVFAVHGDTIAMAVDAKPKRTTRLKRLANIRANPNVCLLADEYDDDWRRLWWVRADGAARIVESGRERGAAIARLAERYRQYRTSPPEGAVVLVSVHHWSGWSA